MTELDAATGELVGRHAARGTDLAAAAQFEAALLAYNDAWVLLPEPKAECAEAIWLLAALADAAFLGGFFVTARTALDEAMGCPGAIGNPFLHLRRGEVLFEQGEFDPAADELIRAYALGGPEIFAAEPAQYLAFLGERAQLT